MQGLEKPVIILSTAVTRPGSFVGDAQRLNVALTRAKHHLILVTTSPVTSSLMYRAWIQDCVADEDFVCEPKPKEQMARVGGRGHGREGIACRSDMYQPCRRALQHLQAFSGRQGQPRIIPARHTQLEIWPSRGVTSNADNFIQLR